MWRFLYCQPANRLKMSFQAADFWVYSAGKKCFSSAWMWFKDRRRKCILKQALEIIKGLLTKWKNDLWNFFFYSFSLLLTLTWRVLIECRSSILHDHVWKKKIIIISVWFDISSKGLKVKLPLTGLNMVCVSMPVSLSTLFATDNYKWLLSVQSPEWMSKWMSRGGC